MKYLVNKLDYSNLSLNDSRLFVARGGWAPISDSEAESDYVVEAIRNGWAEVSDTKPTTAAVPEQPPLEFVGESNGSAELKPAPALTAEPEATGKSKKTAVKAE